MMYKKVQTTLTGLGFLALIGIVVLLIVLGPLLVIWSLNTLFPVLGIPYTWKTWLSVLVLSGTFGSTRLKFKTKTE